ncbi:putative nuclease HARBI1 [Stylophora pistillata]|uniref:Putative nuclease HARBI1 n=1 Tax=Stylophora pistillata TaxID=50429 RepID=A0A2B4STZ9_STYPI|nr:putative nuclease HARBI1 [Stylophora pistillata]
MLEDRLFFQDVVEALFNLRNVYIKFPITEAETWVCVETFQDVSDFPNIVGAIDGSHIRIAAPPDSAVDYFSRYQQHDFIVQAIVDENDQILTGPVVRIGANEIKPYLVGDSAYPLASWLQKPFPEATRDPEEIAFNRALSAARVAVECAFDGWNDDDNDDPGDQGHENNDDDVIRDGDDVRSVLREYIANA